MAQQFFFYPPPPQPQVAPKTPIPTQGQPPPVGNWPSDIILNVQIRSWQPPDPMPWQKPLTFAPLTLPTGQQPPPYSVAVPMQVRQTWNPPDPQPWQLPLTIASIVSIPGQQPPKYSAAAMLGIVQAWRPAETLPIQLEFEQIAAVIPVIVVSAQPWPGTVNLGVVLRAWVAADPQPIQPKYIAPLTLSYGQQPPPWSSVSLNTLVRSWQPAEPYPVQLEFEQIAAVIPVVIVAAQPFPNATNLTTILRAWTSGDPLPQQAKQIAPLTMRYGSAPPIGPTQFQIAGQVIARAWQPPDPMPTQKAIAIPPLTLPTGQQPPRYSTAVLSAIVSTWQPGPPPIQFISYASNAGNPVFADVFLDAVQICANSMSIGQLAGTITRLQFAMTGLRRPTSVTSSATSATNDATGVDWVNPANVFSEDGIYATAALSAGSPASSALNVGFNLSTVPDGAIPVGMLLEIKRSMSGGAGGDLVIRPIKAGIAVGDNLAVSGDWPAVDAYRSYGGATSLWNATWTVADWKNAGFGFAIEAARAAGSPTMRIDHVRLTVYYSTPSQIVDDTRLIWQVS